MTINNTELKNKTVNSFIWDTAGKLILQASGFIFSIILARLLTPDDFGLVGLLTVVIFFANVFLDMGFGSALIQKKEVTDSDYSAVFIFNISIAIILSVAFFFSSSFIANFYNKPVLENLAKIMSPIFIFSAFGTVINAKLRKELAFDKMTKATIFGSVFSGIIGITAAFLKFGVWSLVIQSLILPLLTNLYLLLSVKWRPQLSFSIESLKTLWPFGSKLFVTGILDMVFINIDSLIIGKLFSVTTLGYYYRAKSIEGFAARYTSGSLASVLYSTFSKIQDDLVAIQNAIQKLYSILSIVSFYICGLLLICSRELFIILFTAKWEPAILIFQLLIASAFTYQIQSIFGSVLLSLGKSNKYLYLNIFSKVLRFISLLFLFFGGVNAFLISCMATNLVLLFVYIYFTALSSNLDFSYIYRDLIKNLILYTIIIVGFLFLKKNMHFDNLFFNLTFYAVSYTGSFFLVFKLFNRTAFDTCFFEIRQLLTSKFKLFK